MMKRFILCVALLAVAFEVQAYDVPADPWAHPRLWLTAAKLESLQARAARNTAEWDAMKDWVDSHMTTDPRSWQGTTSSRVSGYTLAAISHSLVFQVDPTHPRAQAQRAYNLLIAIDSIAVRNSIGDEPEYDAITVVSEHDSGYNSRRIVYGAAITYDWCYDSLSVGQRNRLRDLLTAWTRAWYLRREAEPDGSSCFDPGNNFFGGHMIAMISAGYALYYENTDADSIWAKRAISYGRDTMLVESEKAVLGHKQIWDRYGNYENSI